MAAPARSSLADAFRLHGGQHVSKVPITPALLFDHPESRRDALAMVPWTILSAAGVVLLIDLSASSVVTAVAVAAISLATIFSGARFVRAYFHDYPVQAAPYFQYGTEQAIAETQKLGPEGAPVFITNKMEMPYIYLLFFDRYPPDIFQHGQVEYVPGEPGSSLYAGVAQFDRYRFGNPQWSYRMMPQGVFVFLGNQDVEGTPAASISYLDGRVAYRVMVKRVTP